MGALLSSAGPNCRIASASEENKTSSNESYKKQKMSLSFSEDPRLIPTLPDEITIQILARIPRVCYFDLKLVSRRWKAVVTNPELFKLRKELGMKEEWLYILTKVEDDRLSWHALDPLSRKWQRLPPLPTFIDGDPSKASSGVWMWKMVGPSIRIAEIVKGWLGWKDTLDQTPFCGCAIGAVDGCLYVLGGFSRTSTVRCVWRFDPITNSWSEVSSMSIGRAYCKTGILNDKLYVVGGVSRGRGGLTPLQSAEVFDPGSSTWSHIPNMPFSRAQSLPNAFLADMLKPIATGMTPYMGKLCVPQSLYSWPFFVDVGGEIYDPGTDSWEEMPNGMGEGWPARQAGTKLSVVVDGELYAFDPSNTSNNGKIKVYDQNEDAWKVVIRKVPTCGLSDSDSPYLLTGFHGKLHVITKDNNRSLAVLRADPCEKLDHVPLSSHSVADRFLDEATNLASELDTVVWKVIANRDFGSAELVNCQVLDI